MISQLLAIARNALVESVRQPIVLLLILGCGVLQVFNTWNTGFSLGMEESAEVSGDNKLLFDIGLATIFVVGTLLAGFIATSVMSREIENKTVLMVVSKPVGRPTLVLGKFIGVAVALVISLVIMLVFLMLAIRHGVMSTAADEIDGPVVVFGVGAIFLSMALAGWGNFFYGWSFPQASVLLMLPLSVIGYSCVLLLDKHWSVQPLMKDFRPQLLVACLCLSMAVLVLASVATAASTRLSQVPTILTCLGVFVGSLLANYVLGRHVFSNELIGVLSGSRPVEADKATLANAGDEFLVRLDQPPKKPVYPGQPFYYGPSPNGFPLVPGQTYEAYTGDLSDTTAMLGPGAPSSLIVTESTGQLLRIRNIGQVGVALYRPPEAGDFVFASPTTTNKAAMVAWGAIPNMQYFWLLDAVSQNRAVPGSYVASAAAYSLCQVTAFLSLAVVLFQRRDVS